MALRQGMGSLPLQRLKPLPARNDKRRRGHGISIVIPGAPSPRLPS